MFNNTHEERPYPQLKLLLGKLALLMASYQSKAKFSSRVQVPNPGERGPGPLPWGCMWNRCHRMGT